MRPPFAKNSLARKSSSSGWLGLAPRVPKSLGVGTILLRDGYDRRRKAKEQQGIAAWREWARTNQGSITDFAGPLSSEWIENRVRLTVLCH